MPAILVSLNDPLFTLAAVGDGSGGLGLGASEGVASGVTVGFGVADARSEPAQPHIRSTIASTKACIRTAKRVTDVAFPR